MAESVMSQDQLAVAHALERVIRWLRDSRGPTGLSASALSVLSRLETAGSLRVTDLAEHEGLSQPGMTTLVNRLCDAGLALRGADATDKRVVLVTITPQGVDRVLAYRAARADLIATRLRELSPDHQAALLAALPALDEFVTG